MIYPFIIFIALNVLLILWYRRHNTMLTTWIKSLVISTVTTLVITVSIELNFGNVIAVAFFFSVILATLLNYNRHILKIVISTVISTALITAILHYSYFVHISDPVGNTELTRVLFLYFPILIIIYAIYLFILFNVFNVPLVNSRNPIHDLSIRIRMMIRFFQVIMLVVRHGLYRSAKDRDHTLPTSLAALFESLGGVYIKFGQLLSTRKDIFPANYIDALQSLTDNVKPLADKELAQIIKSSNLDQSLKDFNYEPLAAASIGQVHVATHKDSDEPVIIKVLRPDITQKIEVDLRLLIELCKWLSNQSEMFARLGLVNLAEGFRDNLLEETDFEIEAMNTEALRTKMIDANQDINAPKVYRHLSSKSILVIEKIEGTSINKTALTDTEAESLSHTLMQALLEQIMIIGIYHADPHPGNILITKDKTPTFIDFGSVGYLTDVEKNGLILFIVGYHRKNSSLMTQGLIRMSTESDVDEVSLQESMKRMLYIGELSDDPTVTLIKEVMQMIGSHGLSLSPTVAGAFRAIITLDGTLGTINPAYRLTVEAKKFAENMNLNTIVEEYILGMREKAESRLLSFDISQLNIDTITKSMTREFAQIQSSTEDRKDARHMSVITLAFGMLSLILTLVGYSIESEINTFLTTPIGVGGLGMSLMIIVKLMLDNSIKMLSE